MGGDQKVPPSISVSSAVTRLERAESALARVLASESMFDWSVVSALARVLACWPELSLELLEQPLLEPGPH
jgi:hypothetical protein